MKGSFCLSHINTVDNYNSDDVGLAISHDQEKKITHVGFIVKESGKNNLNLAHFLDENVYLYEPISEDYGFFWFDFLEDYEKTTLFGFLKAQEVFRKMGVPMQRSIILPTECFDAEGKYIYSLEGAGFTCATFILKVLLEQNYPILDTNGWGEPNELDTLKQNELISQLKDKVKRGHSIPIVNIEIQEAMVGKTPRFTPEQVAAGCHYYVNESLKYAFINMKSEEVKSELIRFTSDERTF